MGLLDLDFTQMSKHSAPVRTTGLAFGYCNPNGARIIVRGVVFFECWSRKSDLIAAQSETSPVCDLESARHGQCLLFSDTRIARKLETWTRRGFGSPLMPFGMPIAACFGAPSSVNTFFCAKTPDLSRRSPSLGATSDMVECVSDKKSAVKPATMGQGFCRTQHGASAKEICNR